MRNVNVNTNRPNNNNFLHITRKSFLFSSATVPEPPQHPHLPVPHHPASSLRISTSNRPLLQNSTDSEDCNQTAFDRSPSISGFPGGRLFGMYDSKTSVPQKKLPPRTSAGAGGSFFPECSGRVTAAPPSRTRPDSSSGRCRPSIRSSGRAPDRRSHSRGTRSGRACRNSRRCRVSPAAAKPRRA